MSKQIKGLVLQYTPEELNEHVKLRENYHLALVEKYTKRVTTALEEKGAAAAEVLRATKANTPLPIVDEESENDDFGGKGGYARMSNAATSDTSGDEKQVLYHRGRVRFFRALRDHFVVGKNYRLTTHDLQALELV